MRNDCLNNLALHHNNPVGQLLFERTSEDKTQDEDDHLQEQGSQQL